MEPLPCTPVLRQTDSASAVVADPIPPLVKKPKLLSYKTVVDKGFPLQKTKDQEMLEDLADTCALEPQPFWAAKQSQFPMLAQVAAKVLAVVASGSPVERVFSVGGNLLRPRRAKMSSNTLCNLVFLKCNQHMYYMSYKL